jgi:hypothetical protein
MILWLQALQNRLGRVCRASRIGVSVTCARGPWPAPRGARSRFKGISRFVLDGYPGRRDFSVHTPKIAARSRLRYGVESVSGEGFGRETVAGTLGRVGND